MFFAIITFLFDSKLIILNTICYFFSLVLAHLLWPGEYLPLADKNVGEVIAYRIMIYWLTAICIIIIVYFVEHFLIQAQESTEENVILMGKQLEYFTGNEIIDAILNHDVPHYCAKEVKLVVYGTLPKIDTVSAIDMCTLFSNILSNAIKAANQCIGIQDSTINIQFSGGKKYFSIIVSNSILSQNSIETKGKNHGFGVRK